MLNENSSVKTFLLTESELGFGLNPVLSEAEMMSIVLDHSEEINIMKFFDGKVEQTEKSISFRFASLASLNLFLYNNGVPAKTALGLLRKYNKNKMILAPSERKCQNGQHKNIFKMFVQHRKEVWSDWIWDLIAGACKFE